MTFTRRSWLLMAVLLLLLGSLVFWLIQVSKLDQQNETAESSSQVDEASQLGSAPEDAIDRDEVNAEIAQTSHPSEIEVKVFEVVKGEPVIGLEVELHQAESLLAAAIRTDADGLAVFSGAYGDGELVVHTPGSSRYSSASASVPRLTAAENHKRSAVLLVRLSTSRVLQLLKFDGTPAIGVKVFSPRGSRVLNFGEHLSTAPTGEPWGESDSEGIVTLNGGSGHGCIVLQLTSGAIAFASMSFESESEPRQILQLPETKPVTLVVESKSGVRVSGASLQFGPERVGASSASPPYIVRQQGISDQAGVIIIEDVPVVPRGIEHTVILKEGYQRWERLLGVTPKPVRVVLEKAVRITGVVVREDRLPPTGPVVHSWIPAWGNTLPSADPMDWIREPVDDQSHFTMDLASPFMIAGFVIVADGCALEVFWPEQFQFSDTERVFELHRETPCQIHFSNDPQPADEYEFSILDNRVLLAWRADTKTVPSSSVKQFLPRSKYRVRGGQFIDLSNLGPRAYSYTISSLQHPLRSVSGEFIPSNQTIELQVPTEESAASAYVGIVTHGIGGFPLTGVEVKVHDCATGLELTTVMSDDKGIWKLSENYSNPIAVSLRYPGLARKGIILPVLTASDEVKPIMVNMYPTRSITFRAEYPSGEPAAAMYIFAEYLDGWHHLRNTGAVQVSLPAREFITSGTGVVTLDLPLTELKITLFQDGDDRTIERIVSVADLPESNPQAPLAF